MPLNSKAVYAKSDAAYVPFASRRSTVHSRNGIVSCTQPLAAAAGHKILSQGGNAAVCLNFFRLEVSAIFYVWMLIGALRAFRMQPLPLVGTSKLAMMSNDMV